VSFVTIESGAEAILPAALADLFQLHLDDGERWCVGHGFVAQDDSEG
jgi:hypothetical protein